MSGGGELFLWLSCVCCVVVVTSSMLSHVEQYEVVRPIRRSHRRKRSLEDDQLHPDRVQYDLIIEGQNLTIHLEKNRDLIGKSFTETYYLENGRRVTTSPNQENCFYHGHIEGVFDSSVSVGICSGISGFLRARRQVYLIEPLGRSEDGDHAVYRREHLKVGGSARCGSDSSNTTVQLDQDRGPRLAGLFRSRSWKSKPAAGPQRFVELFVVVDHTEFKLYGGETKSRILGVVNHVDKLYRPLNIRIILVGLEIWTQEDFIEVDIDSETTLDNFLTWRQTDLLKRIKHDNAQFVTGKDFDGDTVGLANKFAMCTENSGGVNQDHHDNPVGLASTIAHEMGHNFGLSHDAAGCVCGPSYSSGNCVMADKLRTGSQVFPEFFSGCSMDQLTEFMARAQPACLQWPGSVRTVPTGPRCGNGLLDAGEECDCGTVEECNNLCCDASTCQLAEGSQCAHGQCCEDCQLKASGSVCRRSAGDCDLPEYCTGESQDCPADSFEMNGKPCYNQAPGFCHDGRCPTREQHCWRLFGPGSRVGSEKCFDLNRRGEEGANCGRNRFGFTPCSPANLKCGSIFCEGGGESITGKRAAYTLLGTECRLAVDDDKSRNIDMVPNGAKCGPDKVCLNHKCVDVAVYGKKEECSKKCNNNGVCNHNKECHCNPGWAPPYCAVQYADTTQGQTGIIAGMCAAVSVVLLVAALITGLMCCKKNGADNYASKRKVHSAPGRLNPVFRESSVKDRPQISQPTFMASTATQACMPLMVTVTPSRPPPQPPQKPSTAAPPPEPEPNKPIPPPKPVSPCKPLPALNKPQAIKPAPPPVPPVKPSPAPPARTKPVSPPVPPAKPKIHRPA
ncbi:disintegrin and metalloproteinase domain-containing protein 8-like isoform X2 [Salarias fasciatus]|uniref:Disintegrin and metalloproteinase domain-containing protein 8-like n=1 Tax=Salarias fasciatus TaxID=181472 RepID=A0A672J5S1_SALFA|nr:disintegrin and metalloproteinase domain-containing protein 8-like isoform X2 [Salarias fasciatus]